jgi:hypothetical protein
MSIHEKAEYAILIDKASYYMLDHAAAAGMRIRPPEWDFGHAGATLAEHHVRLATDDAEVELEIPHAWLTVESAGTPAGEVPDRRAGVNRILVVA